MANYKTGFAYYSVETDRYQDIKIKRLKKDFGPAGIAVYDYLLCEIYRVKGCFLVWDENTAFDVADYFGIKESLVNEIVNYCGVVGLFDKGLLTRGRILTSLAIQKRYLDWSKKAKRTNYSIPENIQLLEEVIKLPEESTKLPEESLKTQSVCDKVKKSKVNIDGCNAREEDPLVSKTAKEVLDYFGFSEMNDFPRLRDATTMLNVLKSTDRLNRFIEQFSAYREYKSLTQERTHGFKAFLGSIEQNFEDGGWNSNNWAKKLEKERRPKNEKNRGNQGKSKPSRIEDAKESFLRRAANL